MVTCARQGPARAHDDPIGRPGHLHGDQYAPPTPSGEVDRIGSTVVPNFVTTHVVTTDRLGDFLAPRTDLLARTARPARRTTGTDRLRAAICWPGTARSASPSQQGPFTRYRRTVRVAPAGRCAPTPRARIEVTQEFDYRLAVPVWAFLFAGPVRGALRGPNRAVRPWWLPPDQLGAARRGHAVAAVRVRRAGRLPRHPAHPDEHLLQGGVRRHRRPGRRDAGRGAGRRAAGRW